MTFIIAYDIADPKRLRAVAKHMVHWAVRVQRSVLHFEGSASGMDELFAGLLRLSSTFTGTVYKRGRWRRRRR